MHCNCCGAIVEAGFIFCDKCGAKIGNEIERRQLSAYTLTIARQKQWVSSRIPCKIIIDGQVVIENLFTGQSNTIEVSSNEVMIYFELGNEFGELKLKMRLLLYGDAHIVVHNVIGVWSSHLDAMVSNAKVLEKTNTY